MRETRRRFVIALAALCTFAAQALPLLAQRRRPMPDPPEPAETQNPAQSGAQVSQQNAARKALLLQNEKEFRAGVERLYRLTSDLRDEVQKTMTTDVLSVRMYKKTEEIEKLVKQLKSKARG
jgi:methyl coenzyme M reductase subunit C-like uncharacterized protein (methanogenesis marker protein 7)